MLNPELFIVFLALTFVLIISPGPIVTLVVATGATRGTRAALSTVAGTAFGNGLLLGAIALGLNWVLSYSAFLFEALRWVGAAYLIWLGIQAWRAGGGSGDLPAVPQRVHFTRGFWVALFNPKSIAFFTAFLPQFVDPSLPAGPQLFIMCAVSVIMAAVMDAGWGVAAGFGRTWFLRPGRAKILARISGTALIGGGLWLAFARRA